MQFDGCLEVVFFLLSGSGVLDEEILYLRGDEKDFVCRIRDALEQSFAEDEQEAEVLFVSLAGEVEGRSLKCFRLPSSVYVLRSIGHPLGVHGSSRMAGVRPG